jgi:hypothetical protein
MPALERERRRFTAALLGADAAPEPDDATERTARGVVVDTTPHLLVVVTPRGEERFLFEPGTTFWRGREVGVGDLREGDDVVVRCAPGGRWVARDVWAQLARVTGVITAADGDTVEVDPGHGRPRATAVIPYRASGRMSVRHPVLEPGYLFDAVGIRDGGEVRALLPATTQPPFPVGEGPRPRPRRDRVPALTAPWRWWRPGGAVPGGPVAVSGSVTWYDPALGRATHVNPLGHLAGAAYPALDRAGDCGPACDRGEACADLPLLSLGTTVAVRNECNGEAAVVEVVDCAAVATRFCDRCAACGGDASGRVAELTLTSFIALGGRPEAGCFNATLTVG